MSCSCSAVAAGGVPYQYFTIDPGFREARLLERLPAVTSIEDSAALQSDVRSPLGMRLVRHISAALDQGQRLDGLAQSHVVGQAGA